MTNYCGNDIELGDINVHEYARAHRNNDLALPEAFWEVWTGFDKDFPLEERVLECSYQGEMEIDRGDYDRRTMFARWVEVCPVCKTEHEHADYVD